MDRWIVWTSGREHPCAATPGSTNQKPHNIGLTAAERKVGLLRPHGVHLLHQPLRLLRLELLLCDISGVSCVCGRRAL